MKNVFRFAVAVAVVLGLVAPALAQERRVVEERSGVILKLSGTSVIVRNDQNEIRKYTGIPAGATVTVDGKAIKFRDLREGMVYTAVRFEDVAPPVIVTMSEVEAMPSSPPPAEPAAATAAPAAAPASSSASAPAAELPSTGSSLPTLALFGFGLLALGLGFGRLARRAV